MSPRTLTMTLFVLTPLVLQTATAGAIRLDSGGDWEIATDNQIGFDMEFLGVTGNQAIANDDGTLRLEGGFGFADFDVLAAGETLQVTAERTNLDFLQSGIDAGYRVTWALDTDGNVESLAQLAMFLLSDGRTVLEFNYNGFLEDALVGYETSLGDSFDLLASLGLSPSQLPGFNSLNGGPAGGNEVLPASLGDYFLLGTSFGEPIVGRYLWVSAPEPSVATLFLVGLLGLMLTSLRGGTSRGRTSRAVRREVK